MALLDVSDNAIIDWILAGSIELDGTLDPLDLSGPMKLPTRGLQITQGAYDESPRRHVLAIKSAKLEGTFSVKPVVRG